MESHVKDIHRPPPKDLDAIPKAKKLIEQSLKQEEKLQHMLANLPSGMHGEILANHLKQSSSRMLPECFNFSSSVSQYNECDLKIKEEQVAAPRVVLGGTVSVPTLNGNVTIKAHDVFIEKEAVLQKKISQEMEWAKEFKKSGNNQAAMQCLKRKKYYESQMSQVGGERIQFVFRQASIRAHYYRRLNLVPVCVSDSDN